MPAIATLSRPLLPLALLALAACSTVDGAGRRVAPGEPFDLTPGAQATLADGGTLRYVALVNDSRCAPDVQCIWAGDAEITIEWTPRAGGSERFGLHTLPANSRHALDAGRSLRLVALARGP
ncbi:MAG TPA: hypothetical protein VLM17_10935, partial [Xanthomonadaceae bacterium]|nr:hypothetical protein [Xanthomonadaceae bacterium]